MSPHAARRAISAVFFANGTALGGWAAHIPDIKHALSLSDRALGLALLASAVGAITTMPLAGSVIHRFGSRNVAVFAGFVLCAIVPCLLLAPSLAAFVAILYLVGACNGQMDVGMNAHSMAVQDRFDRPMISAVHGWFSVGGFAGGAGAAFAAKVGVSPVAHLVASSLVIAMVLVVSGRHLLSADVDKTSEGGRLALPKGRLWLIGLLTMLALISEAAMWDWSAVYLRNGIHAEPWVAAFGFGIASLSMAVARFLGDGWTHRLGRRRLLAYSSLASAFGLVLAVSMPNPPLAIAGFAIAGLGLANMVPILFRAASNVPGISAGYGLAAVTTFGYTGFLAGPAIVGIVAQERTLGFALGTMGCICLIVAASTKAAVPQEDRA